MKGIRIMTYNIQHGKKGLDKIAKVIHENGADIISLNEVDCNLPRSQYIDQAAWLAKELNMNYVFGPAIGKRYGNALLTRFPIIDTENHKFPKLYSAKGYIMEKRACLFAHLETPLDQISIFVVHLGLDQKERQHLVQEMIEFISKKQIGLTFLMGDFNATPDASELIPIEKKFYKGVETIFTYPVPNAKHQIDYIFVDREEILLEYQVVETEASDHFPLLCNYSFDDYR